MSNAKSPLQQRVRSKQMLLLSIGGLVLMAVSVGSAWMMSEDKPEPPPSTTTKSLFGATSNLADREKWRTQSAEDMERMRQQIASQQQASADLAKQLAELKAASEAPPTNLPAVTLPPGVVPPPVAPLPPPASTLTPPATATNILGGLGGIGGPGMVMPGQTPGQSEAEGMKAPPGPGIATISIGPAKAVTTAPAPAPSVAGAPRANSSDASATRGRVQTSGGGYRTYEPDAPLASNRAGGETAETYIPAGAFGRAVLVGGLDAPTGGNAQSQPHPVLLRILGDLVLPSGVRLDLKDCVVTGNGFGDLSSERALIRTDRLSCIDRRGGAIDVAVRGHVNGEDGKAGMRGRLVTKTGAVIANALYTGTLASLGTATRESATQTINTSLGSISQVRPGSEFKAALGEGVGKAFEKVSDYYLSIADKMFPVIEVDSMRVVDVMFTMGFSIQKGI